MIPQEHPYRRYGAYDLIKSILLGLVILAAGIAIGASLMILYRPAPQDRYGREPEIFAEQMLGQLGRELNLTPQQRRQLEPILRQHHETLTDIRASVRPQIVSQLEQLNDDITAILTPEQADLWQRKVRRIEERFPTFRGPGRRQGPRPGMGPGFGRPERPPMPPQPLPMPPEEGPHAPLPEPPPDEDF